MIVGFPGETEEDFERNARVCWTKSEYDAVFAFKYSPRPNTPALQLEDAIPKRRSPAAWTSCMRSSGKSSVAYKTSRRADT